MQRPLPYSGCSSYLYIIWLHKYSKVTVFSCDAELSYVSYPFCLLPIKHTIKSTKIFIYTIRFDQHDSTSLSRFLCPKEVWAAFVLRS